METVFQHRNLLERLVNLASTILLVLIGSTLLVGVFAGDIQFWDEATNLQVIVESSAEQDFWNLRYQGEHFWEKPPLFYWFGIVIYKLAGSDPLVLPYLIRGFTAFVSFCLISIVFALLRRKSSVSGFIWLALISMVPFFWQFSPTGELATHNLRSADSDMLQLLFILLSSLAGYKFRTRKGWGWLTVAGILSALAIFTKGPLGILPMLLLLIPFAGYKPKLKYFLIGFALALSITSVWVVLMVANFGGDFWQQYFIYHQLSRANSALEGHSQPWWFYPRLLVDVGFSGPLLPSFMGAIILILRKRHHSSITPILLVMAILSFVAVQFTSTKIAWYLLPAGLFACIFISSVKIKLNYMGVFLIYFLATVSLFSTLFLFISQSNTLQGSMLDDSVQVYCSSKDHRIFNFYSTAAKLSETDLSSSSRVYVDLNYPDGCPLAGQIWELERLVSGNYAILKLK
jgi:4-amino-4-deoxy-L-arabinose transferase-like glycosyltransferase